MTWNIDKSFDFCYGHRVWNQTLDKNFSLDSCLVCRHLHGHQGKIKIHLEAEDLSNGMVTDFKHLNWFKKFLDDYLDHKMIFDINDPLLYAEIPEMFIFYDIEIGNFPSMQSAFHYMVQNAIMIDKGYFYFVNMDLLEKRLENSPASLINGPLKQALIEKYEGLVFVDFVPTSENICAWIARIVENKMSSLEEVKKGRVKVKSVEFWETPKSHCEFKL